MSAVSSMERSPRARQMERYLEEARTRLVETGTRNRLVHVNRNGKRTSTISILHRDTDLLFQRLASDASLRFLADPEATLRERKTKDPNDNNGLSHLTAQSPYGSRNDRTKLVASDETFSSRADIEYDVIVDEMSTITASADPDLLQTRLGQVALEKRLTRMALEAKTLEEEQGISSLYLAIGFLRWFEDENSQVAREAPLILVPIQIRRDIRRGTFDIRMREDDIGSNLALSERLRGDFGIGLPELLVDEEFVPSSYFAEVREAVASKSRWTIDPTGIEIGQFSFAKLLMFNDLSGENWPDELILDHPLLRGLLQEGFGRESDFIADDARLDDHFRPGDLVQVLDADGSQTRVIETVRSGRNLVVQGPPGTGKSQTIANIIAAAVHDGKSVLFVAEKMVALQVVHKRLVDAGLGAACLELHSRLANKKSVLTELQNSLDAAHSPVDLASETERLQNARDRLNRHSARMHQRIRQSGKRPFNVLGVMTRARGLGRGVTEATIPDVSNWSEKQFSIAREALSNLASQTKINGSLRQHPWYGISRLDLQPTDLERLRSRFTNLVKIIDELCDVALRTSNVIFLGSTQTLNLLSQVQDICSRLLNIPSNGDDFLFVIDVMSETELNSISLAVDEGAQLKASLEHDAHRFNAAGWVSDPMKIRSGLVRGVSSFFARFGRDYRMASSELSSWLNEPLPKKAEARLELLDQLLKLKTDKSNFEKRDSLMSARLGSIWQGLDTDFKHLRRCLDWFIAFRRAGHNMAVSPLLHLAGDRSSLGSFVSSLSETLPRIMNEVEDLFMTLQTKSEILFESSSIEAVSLQSLSARLRRWNNAIDAYDGFGSLRRADQAVRETGLTVLADNIADGYIPSEKLVAEFDHATSEILWKAAITDDPTLGQAAGQSQNEATQTFRALEKSRLKQIGRLICNAHLARIPRGALGEMGIIRGEIAKKRGHMPIRRLIEKAGKSIMAIKPVFLMSPISVAQFLAPGLLTFDILVIDEASQVRPEEALGVIARAKQLVVVGDRKQLPPSSFFSRVMADDAETTEDEEEELVDGGPSLAQAARATAMESILTLCEARGLNSAMLRWHYRSKHPSLIEVSNAEFYKGLILPPSPTNDRDKLGFISQRVNGAFDRGGKGINTIEAQAIVDCLAEHARNSPERTVGVITFSVKQRDEVNRLLHAARLLDSTLHEYINNAPEEVFVKNLENVQGDERDVILISVGYGPRLPGNPLDSMNFGPVSTEGGERRLNVLFTRARLICRVFVSFDSVDIDLKRTSGEGPRILKRFLAFAETGILDQPMPTGQDADSPFEEDVEQVIQSLGYPVDRQVGSAGFRLDLAVRDPVRPGRYILAVECDGATYHSALWARERDRLRQDILEQMGWSFHRIWSTDWFYRRGPEIERLRLALEAARSAEAKPSKPPITPNVAVLIEPPVVKLEPNKTPTKVVPYTLAKVPVPAKIEPHEASDAQICKVVVGIVGIEGPVHEDEVARRVASLFGKERTGSRIVEKVNAGLTLAKQNKELVSHSDGTWATPKQVEDCPIRDRSRLGAQSLKAEMLPSIEIAAAASVVIEENGSVGAEELAFGITRLFGFQRTGPDLKLRVDKTITDLVIAGKLTQGSDGMIRTVKT